jgi:hypothetical protein
VNIFTGVGLTREVFSALPETVKWSDEDVQRTETDGQVRLWWDETPVDIFLSTTEFHDQVATRIRVEPFARTEVPFVSCTDLAAFKVFFNRTRDWADLEEMAEVGTLDFDRLIGVLVHYLGAHDERIERAEQLRSHGRSDGI